MAFLSSSFFPVIILIIFPEWAAIFTININKATISIVTSASTATPAIINELVMRLNASLIRSLATLNTLHSLILFISDLYFADLAASVRISNF